MKGLIVAMLAVFIVGIDAKADSLRYPKDKGYVNCAVGLSKEDNFLAVRILDNTDDLQEAYNVAAVDFKECGLDLNQQGDWVAKRLFWKYIEVTHALRGKNR